MLILRLLLRKLIVSVGTLIAFVLSPLGTVGYLAMGAITAVVLAPTMWGKLRLRSVKPNAYALSFVIDTLTWPDSILTQVIRCCKPAPEGYGNISRQ